MQWFAKYVVVTHPLTVVTCLVWGVYYNPKSSHTSTLLILHKPQLKKTEYSTT